jgi:hypothetical protein
MDVTNQKPVAAAVNAHIIGFGKHRAVVLFQIL